MRLIDRYVIREVLGPFVIGLLIFTFILIIPYLIDLAEQFISKGVSTPVIAQLMWTLVPQAVSLTIPMSILLGLLVAFGRLSSDREFVAMQACGVSLRRLLRPVAVITVLGWAATSYTLLVALPDANQRFREITFNIAADLAEGQVRPRVFFEDFPDLVLYVREVPTKGGWEGVFMADNRPGQPPAVYLARHGRVVINREQKTVDMVLQDVTRHTPDAAGKYEVSTSDRLLLSVNPERMFPRKGPQRGVRELSIADLQTLVADLERRGEPSHGERMEIHKKFAIPAACFVFGLIGLALGASNRRDGRIASFVLGIAVIFIYYVFLWMGMAMAKGHLLPPWLAVWLANIVLGGLGALLFRWRDRAADQPIRVTLPGFVTRLWGPARSAPVADPARPRPTVTIRIPQFRLPMPGILDRYVAMSYIRVFGVAFGSMAALFYISTFLDLSDKIFKGTATWDQLLTFFWYATPQYIYYVIPLSVLLASLVTIGLLTKNSELIVMKACGISLYRVAVPMLLCAAVAGLVLFALEESVLGPWNRRAEAIRHVMRGGSPLTFDVLDRRWMTGTNGEIYHYMYFDPRRRQLTQFSMYEFSPGMQSLVRRTYADRALYLGGKKGAAADAWHAEQGWMREFTPQAKIKTFEPFAESRISIEPASHFNTQTPEPKYMSYSQLQRYTGQLRDSGFDVIEQQVALARKVSFPFVTLIMTLIAVPFAVTTGRRGAMYGIGIGIVLAIVYWTTISIFAAIGQGGLIAPALAAWAPNLLFGAAAGYLLLTVRT